MSKCALCKIETPIDEMVADHIKPLSLGGKNDESNIRWVHRACHRNKVKWYYRLYFRFMAWLDGFEPCPKEAAGYNCQHRIMSNGKKECGND